MAAALLEVDGLRVTVPTPRGPAAAVRGVSLQLARGQTLGLIGESGSGKTLTALALLGLLPVGAAASGSVRLDGRELIGPQGLDEATWCTLRGRRIGMVFQEPLSALNPLHRVGRQVAEPLRLHRGLSAAAAAQEAERLLERVGLPAAARRARAFPHELSGGQRQRVMIAQALACGPELLIADEPTSALDVTVQRQILALIADLVAERQMALLLISHDLGVIAENVERMLVMYGGTVVEEGPTARVFETVAHPYTQGLLAARPRLGATRGTRLATLAGTVPELAELPAGCPFAPRCPLAAPPCRSAPIPATPLAPGHWARCLRLDEAAARRPAPAVADE